MKPFLSTTDDAASAVNARNDRSWLRQTGFTLIELMIVLLVISILAAIAYPSYIGYVVRTKRTAAESCLSQYANYMERFYTTNLNYSKDASGTALTTANMPTLDCAGPSQTQGYYQYKIASSSTTAYKLEAVPLNGQLSRDTKCGTLSLDQTGARGRTGSGTVAECWK